MLRLKMSNNEDHVSVRQKLSIFMLWTKLECKIILNRPCKATNPSGAREKEFMILDFPQNLIAWGF